MNQDERRQDVRFTRVVLEHILPRWSDYNHESLFKLRARAIYHFLLLFRSSLNLDFQHHLGTLPGPKAGRLRELFQLVIYSRRVGFNAGFSNDQARIAIETTYQNLLLLGQQLSGMHAQFDEWLTIVSDGFEFNFGDERVVRIPTFEEAGCPGWHGDD